MIPAQNTECLVQVELGRSFCFPGALPVKHKERVEGFRVILSKGKLRTDIKKSCFMMHLGRPEVLKPGCAAECSL